MESRTTLGKSSLQVPRLGVGAMTWGDPKGLARLHPAKTAYGGAHGIEEEKRAVEESIAAGVDLFDTAAMYSGGAAERSLATRSGYSLRSCAWPMRTRVFARRSAAYDRGGSTCDAAPATAVRSDGAKRKRTKPSSLIMSGKRSKRPRPVRDRAYTPVPTWPPCGIWGN